MTGLGSCALKGKKSIRSAKLRQRGQGSRGNGFAEKLLDARTEQNHADASDEKHDRDRGGDL